jgi:hypothetical protein
MQDKNPICRLPFNEERSTLGVKDRKNSRRQKRAVLSGRRLRRSQNDLSQLLSGAAAEPYWNAHASS